MGPEGSLPCLQAPTNGPYSELDESSPDIPILILSPHVYLGLLSGLFPSGFLIKILYAFLIIPMHATYSTHLILLDLITVVTLGEAYKL